MATRSRRIETYFPNLNENNYDVTSPQTASYNCIAWAAGEDGRKWWPDQFRIGYWPTGVSREETLDSFIAAYKTLGYRHADDGSLEDGYEKIVIYVKAMSTEPTHAAKQLSNGTWSSKLGDDHDIMHQTPELLNGRVYGVPTKYMKRKIIRSN